MNMLDHLMDSGQFMPHGGCYLWTTSLIALHAISDAFIALAYYSIPFTLIYFVRKRKDLKFHWMFVFFAVFILACGTSHLLEIWNIWHANYWLSGGIKAITALASVPTAILLVKLIPHALALPSPSALQKAYDELEYRVQERTAEISQTSKTLAAEIIERKRAQEKSAWLASFPEQNPNPIIELDLNTAALSYANPSCIRVFPDLLELGLSHPYLAGLSGMENILRTNQSVPIRREIIVGERCFAQNINYIAEGDRVRIYGADITERKRAEATQMRLAAIVNSSEDAIIGKTLEGVITSWNPGAEKMFGYPAAEAIGQPMLIMFPTELVAEEAKILARIGRGESLTHYETVRVCKDGKRIDVSVTISPVTDSEGKIIGASKIARDITDRKQTEAALKESQAHLRFSLESAQLGDWNLDLLTGKAQRSLRHAQCFGYTDSTAEWGFRQFIAHVHPEDRAWVEREFREATTELKPWDFECRVVWPDGSTHWIAASGSVYHQDGKPTRMLGIVADITPRKQVEAKLRESEESFRTMANSMSQLAWIAQPDGFIFWYNQRWYDYTGTTPEQMEGWGWQKVHDPEVLPKVIEQWSSVIAAGLTFEMEFPLRGADGKFRRFLTRAVPLKDAQGRVVQWFGTNTDVDELKRVEDSLRESQALYHSLVEQMPAGVFRKDAEGRYVFVSSYFCRLRNTTPDKFLGRLPRELPATEERFFDQATNHHAEIMRTRQSIEVLDEYHRSDGATLYFHVVKSPVYDGTGKIIGSQGVLLDVTTNKQAEDEIRRLNAELEQRVIQRTAQLEAANKELEAFSYSVSHDLRAPLRAVNGFAGIVLEDFGPQLPDDCKRYLERIREGGQRMGDLIDDLLAFARLSRQPLNRHTVDTVKLVWSTLDDLKPHQDEREIEFRIGELPPCHGDPALLKQVWINLLSNAIKYSRGRKPAVVEIGCVCEGGRNIYFIRDNGTGFDMQYAHKLFGVFQRLHRADEYEGTGVGLAIVQRIIHRHGGRVWVEAKENQGATFYFNLEEKGNI